MAVEPPVPPDKPPDLEQEPANNNLKNDNTKQKKAFQKRFFSDKDLGPFEIYVQHKEKNVGNYNILSIAKEIFNMKLDEIIKINKKGKNRIGITFSNYKVANNLLQNNLLENKGYEAFIPSHHLQCKGIVRFVDKNLTEEEIKEFSSTNSFVSKILEVRRLNRRVIEKSDNGQDKISFLPTGTISVIFAGRSIPKEIKIFGLPMKVTPYIEPVLQCRNCFIYGHSTSQCRSKSKCHKCSKTHENNVNCNTFCMFCKSSEHQTKDPSCPERIRQKEIKQLMSIQNISYYEAGEKIPRSSSNQKVYNSNENDYPELSTRSREQNQEAMSENEKRNRAIQDNQMPSYRQALTSGNSKRKRHSNEGYNKTEHKTCLINPNGRVQENPHYYRKTEEECIQMDVIQAMNSLTEQHREQVMSFIGSLINSFYAISSENLIESKVTKEKNKVRDEMDCSDESEQYY